jgi:tetratricopeptide (TPR) repeat protein
MKRLGVFSLLLAVCGLIVFAVGKIQSMSPRHNFALGKAAYEKREYKEAVEHFSRVIQLDSRFPHIFGWRASCYRFLGEDDLAEPDMNEDIKLNPTRGISYCHRGDLYYLKANYDRAIEDYTKAIDLNYERDTSYLRRAEAYVAKKDHDHALADFDKALELNPHNAGALVDKGQMHRKKKDYEQAQATFEKAIQQFPDYPRGYNNLAWLLATCPDAKFRNGTKAVEWATKGNELTSWKEPEYLDTLAAAHAESGNFDQAVKWIKEALAHEKTDRPQDLETDQKALKLYESRKPYRED